MLTTDSLLQAGYRKWTGGSCVMWNADALYQKSIELGGRILFYINVWWYDHRQAAGRHEGFQPEVMFREANGRQFEVRLVVVSEMTVEEMERRFMQFYERMECVPRATEDG